MNKLELIENLKEHYKTILEASRISRGAFKGLSPEEIQAIVKQENARLNAREKRLEDINSGFRKDMVNSQRMGVRVGSKPSGKLKDLTPFVANPKPSFVPNKNSLDLSIRRRVGSKPSNLEDYSTFAFGQGEITAAKGFGETGRRKKGNKN
jgi:hypothetical protein